MKALIGCLLAMVVVSANEVTLFPLADPTDPVIVADPIIDTKDPDDPAIWVQLENTTPQPIPTKQVWLRASQFFTPSEMLRNGDRVAYFCGRLGPAEFDEFIGGLPPHERVTARFKIGSDCKLDAPHVHLFIHVSSIGPGPIDEQIWHRDPQSFARLLAAAMPHQ